MVEKPEISPICGKNSAHAEIRVHKICVFLGRTVHTHGKITGWGKLLKKKPPPFRITKSGMLPVKRTIKNNKFLYRQPCYGWRYFMLLLYIAHDISLVSLHAVSFEVVGCCSNLCN